MEEIITTIIEFMEHVEVRSMHCTQKTTKKTKSQPFKENQRQQIDVMANTNKVHGQIKIIEYGHYYKCYTMSQHQHIRFMKHLYFNVCYTP